MHRQYAHLDTDEGIPMDHLLQLMELNDLQLKLRDLYWDSTTVPSALTAPLWERIETLEADLGVLDVIA